MFLHFLLPTVLFQIEHSLASCVTRLFVPEGSDAGKGGGGVSSPSCVFSIHTVIAADTAGGGTWVGALEYSDPALLSLGEFHAPSMKPQTASRDCDMLAGISSRQLLQKQMLLVGGGDVVVSMKWFGWMQQWHVTYDDSSCCIFDGSTGQLLRHVKDSHSFPVPSLPSILAAPVVQAKSNRNNSNLIYVKNGSVLLVGVPLCIALVPQHIV
jgi:hypothetical protein